jgi:hypothetical protein
MPNGSYIPLCNGGRLYIQAVEPPGNVKYLWLDITSGAVALKNYSGSAWGAATVEDGTVTTAKLAAGAISADAAGIALFADDFFTAAAVLAKFAADSFDNAQLILAIKDGAFNADAATRALFDAGIWTLDKLATTAKLQFKTYQTEDLAANGDITARPLIVVPANTTMEIVSIDIVPIGSSAGVDDSNTSVWTFTDGTNTIVTKTFDADPAFPADGVVTNLGALDETHKILAAGEKLCMSVANGTTANLPPVLVQYTFVLADA